MWIRRYADAARQSVGEQGSVVTIGAYDGVHIGHQALLKLTVDRARESAMPSVVMSFEPTPKEFFAKNTAPARITRFSERARLFRDAGVDGFFCLRFDQRLASISVDDFIQRFLVDALAVRHLVIGDDFRFGYRAEGSVADLVSAGRAHGFSVTQIGSVLTDDQRTSSTAVREALRDGDMSAVAKMLGRPFCLSGRVVHGKQLGRTLGFPTANLRLKRRVSPVSGVFAVRVHSKDGTVRDGVASVGTRPTVGGEGVLLEVYVFDFHGDLYGQFLDIEMVRKLRDELKFDSLVLMTAQMHIDMEDARRYLRGDV